MTQPNVPSSGNLIVLSDLHLWGPSDPLYRALLQFLDDQLQPQDKFFIVGDLFDLFVGSKTIFIDRFYELIHRLQSLGDRGVEIFYVEGNHDFHLEDVFEECPHIKLYSDSLFYEWDGRKFYFCHGDRINWKDVRYQAFRFLTRNLFTQCLIEIVPGIVVDQLGRAMAKASRNDYLEQSDVVVKLFRNHACEQIINGFDFVIMGHSHFLDNMRFRINDHEGQYVNVGYPRYHKKYLYLSPGSNHFQHRTWNEIAAPLGKRELLGG